MRHYEVVEVLEQIRTDIGRREYIEALNKIDRLCSEAHGSAIVCARCEGQCWWGTEEY